MENKPFFCQVFLEQNGTRANNTLGFWHVWPLSAEALRRCYVLQGFVMAEPAACVAVLLYLWTAYSIWYAWDSQWRRRPYFVWIVLFVLFAASLCFHTVPVLGFHIFCLLARRALQWYVSLIFFLHVRPQLQKRGLACRVVECIGFVLCIQIMTEVGIEMNGYTVYVTDRFFLAIEAQLLVFTTALFWMCLSDHKQKKQMCLIFATLFGSSLISGLELHPLLSLFNASQRHVWTALWAWYAVSWCGIFRSNIRDSMTEDTVHSTNASQGITNFDNHSPASSRVEREMEPQPLPDLSEEPENQNEDSFLSAKQIAFLVGGYLLWGYVSALVSLLSGKILFYDIEVWQVVLPAIVGAMLTNLLTPYWIAAGYLLLPVWLPYEEFAVLLFVSFALWSFVSCYQTKHGRWRSWCRMLAFFLFPGPWWTPWLSRIPSPPERVTTHSSAGEEKRTRRFASYPSGIPPNLTASLLGLPKDASSSPYPRTLPGSMARPIPVLHSQPIGDRQALSLPDHPRSPSSVLDVRAASMPNREVALPMVPSSPSVAVSVSVSPLPDGLVAGE